MSNQAIQMVWQHSRHHGSRLLTLLALAEIADEHGRHCSICLPSLAAKVKVSKRQILRNLAQLEASSELIIFRRDGRCNQYDLSPLFESAGGDTSVRETAATPPASRGEGVTSTTVETPSEQKGEDMDDRETAMSLVSPVTEEVTSTTVETPSQSKGEDMDDREATMSLVSPVTDGVSSRTEGMTSTTEGVTSRTKTGDI